MISRWDMKKSLLILKSGLLLSVLATLLWLATPDKANGDLDLVP